MIQKNNCAVILAAGEGKRMQSKLPKVLCPVLFKPMVDWVIDAAAQAVEEICLVVGHGGDQVRAHTAGRCRCVEQKERLGTGHAVMQAADFLRSHADGHTPVSYTHLISANTLYRMRKGYPITTKTLDTLCFILDCEVSDILYHDKSK